MVILKKLIRFWELNCGWFFINPRKQDRWYEYLRKKYSDEK